MSTEIELSEKPRGTVIRLEPAFALADGKALEPTKADPVRVGRGMSIAQGFEIIVSSCLRHFQLNEPTVVKTRNVEALHQARVAIRRLRSALGLFRPVVADQEFERVQRELRWLVAEFGDARNLDVYLEHDLSRDQRLFVEERRKDAYDRAIAAMSSDRSRQLMLDILSWAAGGHWRKNERAGKSLRRFINRRIDRLWSKVSGSERVARTGDRRRHRLRIQVKKLRYALEFAEGLHGHRPRGKRKFAKTLKQLQGSLGRLHDDVTARSLVTLNSWLATSLPFAEHERRLVRNAGQAIDRLRNIGPYWR